MSGFALFAPSLLHETLKFCKSVTLKTKNFIYNERPYMSTEELVIIKKGYDFTKWLLQHTGRFPKSYRFSVAAKLENALHHWVAIESYFFPAIALTANE